MYQSLVRLAIGVGLLILLCGLMSCRKELCNASPSCGLSPDPGPCEGHQRKFYYNADEGKCMEFVYGGCNGVVPFETLEECETCLCNRPEVN